MQTLLLVPSLPLRKLDRFQRQNGLGRAIQVTVLELATGPTPANIVAADLHGDTVVSLNAFGGRQANR